MQEQFSQLEFPWVDLDRRVSHPKPPTKTASLIPSSSLTQAGQNIYKQIWSIWKDLDISLPPDHSHPTPPIIRRRNRIISITPRYAINYKPHPYPRLKDLEIPELFAQYLGEYSSTTGFGERSFLPNFGLLSLNLYRENSSDDSEFERLREQYQQWFDSIMDIRRDENHDYEPTSRFTGWKISITDPLKDPPRSVFDYLLGFKFLMTPRGRLSKYIATTSGHQENPYKQTQLTKVVFRKDLPTSIWQETDNGVLFTDPAYSKDGIWPSWVTGTDQSFYYKTRSYKVSPPCEEDWENYLQKIREGSPVISGKSYRLVRQTVTQALENLEESRRRIYYKSRQVFYCRITPHEAKFKSELGYVAQGPFGPYVSYNPKSHQDLTVEDTVRRLSELSASQKTIT